jgi:hypothetical protein
MGQYRYRMERCTLCNGMGRVRHSVDQEGREIWWDCPQCDGAREVQTEVYVDDGGPGSGGAGSLPSNEQASNEQASDDDPYIDADRRYSAALDAWDDPQESRPCPSPAGDLRGDPRREPDDADREIAEANARLLADPPMWRAPPGLADTVAQQGPFGSPLQNRLMYESIGALPLAVAAPSVAAGGAAFFLGHGSAALVDGRYDLALKSFATALALTPSDVAIRWHSERAIHRAAWALQDELERAVLTSPSMRKSLTISVGVLSHESRPATVVVSVNGGAQRSLAGRVRALCQERGIEFVPGSEHAEANIIRMAEQRGFQHARVTASTYHCPHCQARAAQAGLDVALFSPDKGFVNRTPR